MWSAKKIECYCPLGNIFSNKNKHLPDWSCPSLKGPVATCAWESSPPAKESALSPELLSTKNCTRSEQLQHSTAHLERGKSGWQKKCHLPFPRGRRRRVPWSHPSGPADPPWPTLRRGWAPAWRRSKQTSHSCCSCLWTYQLEKITVNNGTVPWVTQKFDEMIDDSKRVKHHTCIGLFEADIAMSSWEGMHLSKGNRWEGERGMGEWGSVYSQLGTRVDGNSRHDTKEGFPSK